MTTVGSNEAVGLGHGAQGYTIPRRSRKNTTSYGPATEPTPRVRPATATEAANILDHEGRLLKTLRAPAHPPAAQEIGPVDQPSQLGHYSIFV